MKIEQRASEYEEATIRAFVIREKQERFIYLLANPKRRQKFIKELGHFRWFDPRFAVAVPWKVDPTLSLWGRHMQGIDNIRHLLESKGAGEFCWVISQNKKADGRKLELKSVLDDLGGSRAGTILICIPGKLAYFEGEDESLLLSR